MLRAVPYFDPLKQPAFFLLNAIARGLRHLSVLPTTPVVTLTQALALLLLVTWNNAGQVVVAGTGEGSTGGSPIADVESL